MTVVADILASDRAKNKSLGKLPLASHLFGQPSATQRI